MGADALLEATHMTALRSLTGQIHPEKLPAFFKADHLQGLTHFDPGHYKNWLADNPDKAREIRAMVGRSRFGDAVKASLEAALTPV